MTEHQNQEEGDEDDQEKKSNVNMDQCRLMEMSLQISILEKAGFLSQHESQKNLRKNLSSKVANLHKSCPIVTYDAWLKVIKVKNNIKSLVIICRGINSRNSTKFTLDH